MRYLWMIFGLLALPTLAVAEVRISAAASLAEVCRELIAAYRVAHPQVEVLANFGSSGALAKQIDAGAPTDIFISANPEWLDFVRQRGLLDEASVRELLHNQLVFVAAPGVKVAAFEELPSLRRIALGSPAAVPAGRYAEQALQSAGLYQRLQAEGRLVPAKDVRQALLYAERGEVDGAFVYRTDALLAKAAAIAFTVPAEHAPAISYPAALTRSGARNPEAQALFAWLFGAQAAELFRRHGFLLP